MQVVVGSNPHGGELVVESGRGGARRVGAGRGSGGVCGTHIARKNITICSILEQNTFSKSEISHNFKTKVYIIS